MQWTKAIGTLCIMYGHSAALLSTISNCPPFIKNIQLGGYWVALFLLWSGYGCVYGAKNKPNYLEHFLKNRFVRLICPFFTAHVIYFIIKSVLGSNFTVRDILEGMLGQLNIVEYSWYPVIALVLYVIWFVIWKRKITEKYKVFMILGGNIILIIILEKIFFPREWWYMSIMAFAIGVLLYYIPDKLKNNVGLFSLIYLRYA